MWKLTNNYDDWKTLENEFSWVLDMRNVPQDVMYHQEGNVAIHTKMVLDAMMSMPEFKMKSEATQQKLLASVLFHDIEKRSTTIFENGRVLSPGHAKKGSFTTRKILFENGGLGMHEREEIVGLIRYHGFPIWFLEKENPVKQLHRVSLETNTEWLYMLAKADVLGRKCNDQQEFLDRVEMFKLLCEEEDCFGKEKKFPSLNARFHYFNSKELNSNYEPYNINGATVHLMSALPGMGKDYFIDKKFDLPIVSLDDLRKQMKVKPTDISGNGRVVQEAKKRAKKFMADGQDFIWNATNTSLLMREQLVTLFLNYNSKIAIHYIEKPFNEWLRQNTQRESKVPEDVLFKMLSKWQPPMPFEGHEVNYYC